MSNSLRFGFLSFVFLREHCLLSVGGVIVDSDFSVAGQKSVVGSCNERVDLDQVAIFVLEELEQFVEQVLDFLVELRDSKPLRSSFNRSRGDIALDVDPELVYLLRLMLCNVFNIHASSRLMQSVFSL